MKILLFFLLAAAPAFAEAPSGEKTWEVDFNKWLREEAKKWPPPETKEIRAFVFPAARKDLITNGKLRPDVTNPGGTLLNGDQAKRLAAALNVYQKPDLIFMCFEPRNAFVFYDGTGRIIASAEICFECRKTRMQPPEFIPGNEFSVFADLFQELKLPVGEFESAEEFKAKLESNRKSDEEK